MKSVTLYGLLIPGSFENFVGSVDSVAQKTLYVNAGGLYLTFVKI